MRRASAAVCLVVLAGCLGGAAPPATETTTAGPTEGTLEVHFVNVGQSVSTLFVGPTGETMLVDTGDFRDRGEDVLAYLRRHDVERIDYLVSSHADADHVGGNAAIIEYYETRAEGIGAIYDPGIAASTQVYERYLDAVETYDVPLYRTRAGDRIPLSDVDVRVRSPPEEYLAGRDRNENSVVLQVTHGEASFLVTGDAEEAAEEYLVETYGDRLRATVLSAGHHGSRHSTGATLLDAVRPQAVVISSAFDSQYGHPHEETLRRLAGRSILAYWTAVHGDVVLESDGRTVTVATQGDAPTDPLALRGAGPIDPGSTAPLVVRGRLTGEGVEPVTATPQSSTETPTRSPDEGGRLVLASVHPDAEGDDRRNLVDEYVVLTNAGDRPLDLGGWTLQDAAGASYTLPPGVVLDPGATLAIHTGSGTDTDTDLYWGATRPVWNNDGDTITVKRPDGEVVLQEVY